YERSDSRATEIDPVNRAIILDDLARAHQDLGDLDRSVAFGERAIEAFRAAGARHDEGVALERLALTYLRMRRLDDALGAITEALARGRAYGSDEDVANLTISVGRIQLAAGDDDAALASFRGAVE